MSAAVVEGVGLVHATPGRVRVRLPGWSGRGQRGLEARLRRIRGVLGARANPLTGNVLIRFDPAATDEGSVLASLEELRPELGGLPEDGPEPPPAQSERRARDGQGLTGRARIAVRGLDRDPRLARHVVERLGSRPGVRRAIASPLTGRVLVEFAEDEVALEDLLAEVSGLELPASPHEDRPAHPLEPGRARQGATRAAGAGLGLGLLAARRLAGRAGPPVGSAVPAVAGGLIGILQGFPVLRDGLRRLLDRDTADLVLGAAGIATQVLSGSPIGLVLGGAEALFLLSEVRSRRAAWRHYEEETENAPPPHPGAVVRLEAGERTPLAAEVIEGTGTATARDGLPTPIAPGAVVGAGSRLHGGPFVLELRGAGPFTPEPRTAPAAPTLYDRYLRGVGRVALVYAAATALLTRSPSRALNALLLVNPRAAIVGAEAAGSGASARVLRSGVTVVGTRPERGVRLPGVLLLDGPRVLTDGLDVGDVLPLADTHDNSGILARAASVAAAAGSPWGDAFRKTGTMTATDGSFDGEVATARIAGAGYSLRPVGDRDPVPPAARLRNRGDHLLLLRDERGEPLGIVALRPRLAPGVAEMARVCRLHGVEVGLLAAGDPVSSAAVARRAEVPLVADGDAVGSIRERQEGGARVAFVSDNAGAAAAFEACDLAIGLADGRAHLPARADLLAPDLDGVAAIVEAGARRERAVRDSVALSALADAVGAAWGLRARPGVERSGLPTSISALGALAAGWARLRGGGRPRSSAPQVADPRPERWGRLGTDEVLRALDATDEGLSSAGAAERRRPEPTPVRANRLLRAILDQLRSPLTGVLAAGAGLSLVLGSPGDVAMISAMIVANAAAGVWQERLADRTAEALERMGTVNADVLRDGADSTVPAEEAAPEQARTTEGSRRSRDTRCHLLRAQERLSLATLATRLPALGDRLPVVREVARGRHLRAARRRATRAAASPVGQKPAAQRGYCRLPDDQDHRGRQRTERLRRQQEGEGQKAPPAGGHGRLGPQSQGPQRQGARPGRAEAAAGVGAGRALSPQAPVAGCRLPGQGQEVGRGGFGPERGGGAQAAKAGTREGGQEVGGGTGQGGGQEA
ncbi:MAG: hypothetical protein AVDCRST_MAG02-657 [uncultured Rubrobacteraceae bacterium]|uniref:Cation-transporting P-type ATPase N-terminal domain-containing protein n=1 Tax=uncultured Rubrobacteraceae bacterium TaxID=349277 RepID=A0A6J4QT01_9ACTN|nr:MAG: hypothetical protein AVDCRST_MAG02-657 [uncultured Rubrobacteraceae bacterium]